MHMRTRHAHVICVDVARIFVITALALPYLKSRTTVDTDALTVEDIMNAQDDINTAIQETVARALTNDDTESGREKPGGANDGRREQDS
ncbi:hypothetical protein H0H81_000828 [Sphagnurus paluster]|uniref:Uncharacterized protein n=1 Tax=Sphagnurus paluster TaxID=117069 RepID=A0A9P7FUC7_9AGAR|nr:hypothetical protein H0H81_000828 [Sphagnurus paluster]